MIENLLKKKCVPCEGGIPPLKPLEIQHYLGKLHSNWQVIDNQKIRREFDFENYQQVLKFVRKVGKTAIREDHHPVMHVYFQKVALEFMTYAIKGLSENDFIMAAKSEKIFFKINKNNPDLTE